MTTRHNWAPASIMAVWLVATRFAAEAFNTHLWDRANYVWAVVALAVICLFLWPQMAMAVQKDRRLLAGKLPTLFYLLYLVARTDVTQLYPIKCLLSEVIVWFFFWFTVDVAATEPTIAGRLRNLIIGLVKCMVVIGVFQLVLFIIENRTLNPTDILTGRPARSIFVHPSICLIMLLPFLLPFLRSGAFLWAAMLLFTCLATGTRSPFLSMVLLSWVAGKYVLRREIPRKAYVITMVLLMAAYGGAIALNSGPIEVDYAQADSRFSFGTLQWRVQFWQRLLSETTGLTAIIGHGVGSADRFTTEEVLIPPHNDYLRIYFDLGVIGIALYMAVIVSIWRKAWAIETDDRDMVLIVLLMMLSFGITDNFLYVSNRLFLLTFIATYFAPRTEKASPPAAAFAGLPRILAGFRPGRSAGSQALPKIT
ncbi:MAG: O-antigen ligase family protein [Deltaproteobacteria bacterium]|nr:O-antigen ligase family protein [Deltaproteobacteria bacterium]